MIEPADSLIWYGSPSCLTCSYKGLNVEDIFNSVIGLVCIHKETVCTAQGCQLSEYGFIRI